MIIQASFPTQLLIAPTHFLFTLLHLARLLFIAKKMGNAFSDSWGGMSSQASQQPGNQRGPPQGALRNRPRKTGAIHRMPAQNQVLFRIPTNMAPILPCYLKLLKQQRINALLAVENDFISNFSQSTFYKQVNKEQEQTIAKLRGTTQTIAVVQEIIDEEFLVVKKTEYSSIYTKALSFVDRELLQPNALVHLMEDAHRDIVVGVLSHDEDPNVTMMKVIERPKDTYADIGGQDEAIKELQETIQLPLTNPEYFVDLGIEPPRSCILHGPSGTGKSLLARACANETSACYMKMAGSELIQKYSGEGPALYENFSRLQRPTNRPSSSSTRLMP